MTKKPNLPFLHVLLPCICQPLLLKMTTKKGKLEQPTVCFPFSPVECAHVHASRNEIKTVSSEQHFHCAGKK